MSMRRIVARVRAAVAVLVTAGAPAVGAAQLRADTTVVVARNALIDVTVRSGSLLVRGTERANAELRTNHSRYTLNVSGVGMTLGARETGGRDNSDSGNARVELAVPRGVRLVISAGRADVEVRSIDGDVEVHSSSGDITMAHLGGRAIVETLSGDLTIESGVGELRVTTSSGDVIARDVRGEVNVHTTSGDVTLSGSGIPRLLIESISGDAAVEGSIALDGRLRISTHSGDVVLRLADGARGELEFFTHNGELNTAIPLTMSGSMTGVANSERRPGQRFVFGGGGGALISISTFNGDVRIRRGSSRLPDQ